VTGSPIDEYLARADHEQRAALEVLRRTIAKVAPDATEGFSYGMPAFRYRGRPLVGFAAFKKHCSLFPMGHSVLDQLGDEPGDTGARLRGRRPRLCSRPRERSYDVETSGVAQQRLRHGPLSESPDRVDH
jgi:Domain of unknown function (DU1801)